MYQVRLTVIVGVLSVLVACGGGSDGNPAGPNPPAGGGGNLTAPAPQSPANDAQLDTLRPTLVVANASGGSGARVYEFQISDRSDFTASVAPTLAAVVTQGGIAEGASGTTSFTPSSDLQPSTRMYWRARATQGSTTSAWSSTQQFRTRIVGFSRAGELFDPLTNGETLGIRSGNTTFLGTRGLRVENAFSWVRYQLASTLTSGEISVEVEGLQPNGAGSKARIVSMMDNAPNLFRSKFLFNVQYRGAGGNPDNAVSYKVLMGDEDLKYEPDFGQRSAGIRSFNPNTTYLWTATWGSSFRLTIREGGPSGPVVYEQTQSTPGSYTPSPHTAFLGANDAADESGSYAGAIYRNLWVGSGPRPASLGSASDR